MNAYIIARFDMTDPEGAKLAYPKYVEEAGPAYAAHNARFLVRGGKVVASDGPARVRNVVIEFPDLSSALACYKSDIYQAARRHRVPVAEGELVVVDGAVKDHPAQSEQRAYWIGRQDVADAATYKLYSEQSRPAFEAHGGVFLVRGGPHQAMEGQARERNVLIEFPSVRHALDCFHSDVYQRASAHRHRAATGEIVIVEGLAPA